MTTITVLGKITAKRTQYCRQEFQRLIRSVARNAPLQENDNIIADAERIAKVAYRNLPNLTLLCRIHRRIWQTTEQLGKFVRIRHRPDDTKPRQTVCVAEDGIVTLLVTTVSAPDLGSSINSNALTH